MAPPERGSLEGARMIERAISPSDERVLGLYLFMAYGRLARSMGRRSRFSTIKPGSIGMPALLQSRPGLSQTELADLMGIQRMTAGVQVKQCVDAGLVRRVRSAGDKRRYQLYITSKGKGYLRRVAALIPQHEEHVFGCLSGKERKLLHGLLVRLIDSAVDDRYCK
jgi:DNA-binding MarR family transcriptional regulator